VEKGADKSNSMTFEHVPSDYAILKMRVVPSSGGDTLWASGYETYDRLSRPYQKFLEGLTATHDNPAFQASSQRLGFAIHPGPRGAPENVGTDLIAIHPIIRSNPVTGWKSLYSVLKQVQKINELSEQESVEVLAYLARLVNENHDLQVRMKWGKDDVAIVSSSVSFPVAITGCLKHNEYFLTVIFSSGTTDVLTIQLRLILTAARKSERGIELSVWERSHILILTPHLDVKLWGFFKIPVLIYCKSNPILMCIPC
jgi:hypothetical protein